MPRPRRGRPRAGRIGIVEVLGELLDRGGVGVDLDDGGIRGVRHGGCRWRGVVVAPAAAGEDDRDEQRDREHAVSPHLLSLRTRSASLQSWPNGHLLSMVPDSPTDIWSRRRWPRPVCSRMFRECAAMVGPRRGSRPWRGRRAALVGAESFLDVGEGENPVADRAVVAEPHGLCCRRRIVDFDSGELLCMALVHMARRECQHDFARSRVASMKCQTGSHLTAEGDAPAIAASG